MENEVLRYDVRGLAEELEVDIEDIVHLFESYFTEMKTEIVELQKYLLNQNWDMLERIVHNIKGVSANLKITDIFDEAALLDVLLKENETKEAAIYVNKIIHLLNNAEVEIKKFFLENGISI